ncbi:MAG: carbohydrate-binding protein [Bacteroidales bacterium]|nr:carbohydrate-binding protein [Bacteroidales bacterium]
MKKIDQLILALVLIINISFISSCSNDDEVNEWNVNFVSLQQADYLRPLPSFTLSHTGQKGVEGTVEFECVAVLQKVTDKDVRVDIDVMSEGISAEKIKQTEEYFVVKAGSLRSEPITISITDWSDWAELKEEFERKLEIKISNVESLDKNVAISEIHQQLDLKITKGAFFWEVAWLTNVTDWDFVFMDGVNNAQSNSVNGTGGKAVSTNGVPFWLSVDFGKEITILKVQTKHGYYAPSKVELFSSSDNSDWVSLGEFTVSGGTQTITFDKPVMTRYMKYQMITVPRWSVDISQFIVEAYK